MKSKIACHFLGSEKFEVRGYLNYFNFSLATPSRIYLRLFRLTSRTAKFLDLSQPVIKNIFIDQLTAIKSGSASFENLLGVKISSPLFSECIEEVFTDDLQSFANGCIMAIVTTTSSPFKDQYFKHNDLKKLVNYKTLSPAQDVQQINQIFDSLLEQAFSVERRIDAFALATISNFLEICKESVGFEPPPRFFVDGRLRGMALFILTEMAFFDFPQLRALCTTESFAELISIPEIKLLLFSVCDSM